MPREISEQQIRDRVASFSTNKDRLDYIRGVQKLRDSGQIEVVPAEEESSSYLPEEWLAKHPRLAAEGVESFRDPRFLSTYGRNVPHSFAEKGRRLEQILQAGPMNFLGTLAKVGLGGLERMGRGGGPVHGQPISERGRLFEEMQRDMGASLGDPKRVSEDPLGFLETIADLFLPLKPKSGMLRSAANISVEAPAQAVKAAKRVATPVAKKAYETGVKPPLKVGGELAALGPAFTTGEGPTGVKHLVEAGYAGKRPIAKSRFPEEVKWEDLGEEVVESLRAEKKRLGDLKDSWVEAVDAKGTTIPIREMKERILGENSILHDPKLKDLRIRVSRTKPTETGATKAEVTTGKLVRKRDKGTLQGVLDEIDMLPDNVGVGQLDEVYKLIGPGGMTKVQKNMGRAISALRGELKGALEGVEGWDKVQRPLSDFYKTTDRLKRRMGERVLPEGLTEPNVTNIGQKLRVSIGQEDKALSRSVAEIDQMFPDLNLRAKVAGQAFSSFDPRGIAGRTQAAGQTAKLLLGAPAAGAGGFYVAGVPGAIAGTVLSLAAFSPRVVAETLLAMGASARQVEAFAKVVDRAIKKLGPSAYSGAYSGMTVAELFERTGVSVGATEQEDQSFLGKMGSRELGTMLTP